MKSKRPRPPFVCSLTKRETIFGICFLPVYVFVLPLLIGMLTEYWPTELPAAKVNTVYCLIGFLFILLCLRKHLRADWDRLCDNKLAMLITLIATHLLSIVLSMLIVLVSIALFDDSTNPYDAQGVKTGMGNMFTALVLLSPIVEEVLFRGVLFGALRKKNRAAAYIVSILAYVIASVWQLTDLSFEMQLFCALQAIPAAFALCWSYERSGCIWVPILYHALTNLSAGALL